MQSTPGWGKGPEKAEQLDCPQWLGRGTQTEEGCHRGPWTLHRRLVGSQWAAERLSGPPHGLTLAHCAELPHLVARPPPPSLSSFPSLYWGSNSGAHTRWSTTELHVTAVVLVLLEACVFLLDNMKMTHIYPHEGCVPRLRCVAGTAVWSRERPSIHVAGLLRGPTKSPASALEGLTLTLSL